MAGEEGADAADTAVVDQARAAVTAGDRDRLRLLLHPYLHWTRPDGRRVRGRTQVLALLAGRTALVAPAAYELRDGQIYRWTEPAARG